MLRAYFDESGTSGKERLTVISGFVAKDTTWQEFGASWRSALKDWGLDWFHMVDCENGAEQFEQWGSKPDSRHLAASTMAGVIVRSGLTGFWSSVDCSDHRDTSDAFKDRYPKPYHFCFERCLPQIADWVRKFAPRESVELIFAEQEEYQGRAKTVYGAYMKGKPLAPIQSLRFASMQACAPLQAADMAVYCTNKQMEKDLYAKKTKDEIYRSALDVLYWNRGSFTGEHHDALTLTVPGDPGHIT